MGLFEVAGYLASVLVIMAFCMKDMIWLRMVAIAGNLAFLTYGLGLGLAPVWVLHSVLLPVNCWRLWQALSCRIASVNPSRRQIAAGRPGRG